MYWVTECLEKSERISAPLVIDHTVQSMRCDPVRIPKSERILRVIRVGEESIAHKADHSAARHKFGE